MRKIFTLPTFIILLSCLIATSCGGNEKDAKSKEAEISKVIARSDSSYASLPNYRYVDVDSVLRNYNLAKDYNEEMLRMENKMQSEIKRHESSIQSLATTMQNKLQNNGYLSEASYKQDQQNLADMQNKAQKSVAALQSNYETTVITAQKTVNDSIQAFIEDYNKAKGYDAIFLKAATVYINPALDITDEVIEGLNARYNKVK